MHEYYAEHCGKVHYVITAEFISLS